MAKYREQDVLFAYEIYPDGTQRPLSKQQAIRALESTDRGTPLCFCDGMSSGHAVANPGCRFSSQSLSQSVEEANGT